MAIHNFTSMPQGNAPSLVHGFNHAIHPESTPGDVVQKTIIDDDSLNYSPESVRQVTTKGLYALDEGMKNWLSGIKIQVKDTYKIVAAHFVTKDRSILSWAQDFFNGRVPLPIISIKRTSWNFVQDHYFRPPYTPYLKQYTESGRKVRLIYMPLPFKVNYAVSIWSAFKHDAEYIQTDIVKRCSPLGEIVVQDDYIQQLARIMLGNVNDNSDIDLGAKERPKVVYDIDLSVEYSIPVNEKIVPTVLGKVVSIKERDTKEVFDVYRVEDLV